MYSQREFLDVWLTMMTTLVEAPPRQQLLLVLMDQCCVTKERFFSKRLSCVAAGTVPTRPGFFFLYPPQCRAGASWRAADSQSSVQLALRVGGGGGELDCDG